MRKKIILTIAALVLCVSAAIAREGDGPVDKKENETEKIEKTITGENKDSNTIEKKKTSEKKTEKQSKKITDKAVVKPPSLETGNVILGVGSMALFSFGGGDAHDGEENIEINPAVMLGVECVLYRGFGLGLSGNFKYSTDKAAYGVSVLSLQLSTRTLAWGIGPSLFYYYSLNDRFLVHAAFNFTYKENRVKTKPVDFTVNDKIMEFGLSLGLDYMITSRLGLYVELSHVRDIVESSINGKQNGHITSLDVGLKVFL